MKVLYVGAKNGTSMQRAQALQRLGHDVEHVTPYAPLPKRWPSWLKWLGGPGIDQVVAHYLARNITGEGFDLAHVDSGDVIGPKSLAVIRQHAPVVTNYNADNPYADPPITRNRWTLFRRAAPDYDLAVTIRRPGIEEKMRAKGIKVPISVIQTADEVVHRAPATLDPEWASEVCFVGTWMPGREVFMKTLIEAGVPLTLYGPRWDRSPNAEELKPFWRKPYLEGGDYTNAIAGARIALVTLNGENFDLHTTRSVEIPAIGTAMVAVRTSDHERMYQDGVEAVFFDDPADCARKCLALLAEPEKLADIAAAGHARVAANGHFNESLMKMVLDTARGLNA